MDGQITFTAGQAIGAVLSVCAGITCIAGAIAWIVKAVRAAKAPDRRQDERITALETRVARHDELLGNDKERLDAIEKGNRVTQRAILALLAHGIDGNDVDQMRSAKAELQEYLINR